MNRLLLLICLLAPLCCFGQQSCEPYGTGELVDNTTCPAGSGTCISGSGSNVYSCVNSCLYRDTLLWFRDGSTHLAHVAMGQVCKASDITSEGDYRPTTVTCPAGQGSDVITGECKPLECSNGYSLLCSTAFCICAGDGPPGATENSVPDQTAFLANNFVSPREGIDVVIELDDGKLSALQHFQLPTHQSTCPVPQFTIFDKQYTLQAHCTISEQHRDLIAIVMLLFWTLSGFIIVMKA